jgi:hypothetical protein
VSDARHGNGKFARKAPGPLDHTSEAGWTYTEGGKNLANLDAIPAVDGKPLHGRVDPSRQDDNGGLLSLAKGN